MCLLLKNKIFIQEFKSIIWGTFFYSVLDISVSNTHQTRLKSMFVIFIGQAMNLYIIFIFSSQYQFHSL